MNSHCTQTNCKQIILADTEDWKEPLCYMHWHQAIVGDLYERLSNVIDEIGSLEYTATKLRDDFKQILPDGYFKSHSRVGKE